MGIGCGPCLAAQNFLKELVLTNYFKRFRARQTGSTTDSKQKSILPRTEAEEKYRERGISLSSWTPSDREQPLAKGILLGTWIPNDREREGSHGKAARKRYPAPSSLQGSERAGRREMPVSRADPTLPHRETLEAR